MNVILFLILNQVNISIPDTTAKKTTDIIIPINVSSLTGLEVYSADITVKYRPAVLIADSVSKAGTLSQAWFMDYNADTLGTVRIAMAGVDAAVGAGALIKIAFHVPDSATPEDTGLIYFTKMILNEGDPTCIASPGLFTVGTVSTEENTQVVTLNPQLKAHPNPFTSTTNISLESKSNKIKDYKIQICDVAGKVVKSFSMTQKPNNLTSSIRWDGKDNDGKLVTDGIYFCKLMGTTNKSPIKLILLK